MNNTVTVYRMEHRNIPIGPYGYITNKVYERLGLSKKDVQPLIDVLHSKERWNVNPSQKGILERILKNPVWEPSGVCSSFKVHRPGPWDDPVMKANLRKRFGKEPRLKLIATKFISHFFCFDSMDQFNAWFNDQEELEVLKLFGFELKTFKVKNKNLVRGLKQAWYLDEL